MNSLILYNIITKSFSKAATYISEADKASLMRKFEELRQAYNAQGDIIIAIENYDWRKHDLKDIIETVRKQVRRII